MCKYMRGVSHITIYKLHSFKPSLQHPVRDVYTLMSYYMSVIRFVQNGNISHGVSFIHIFYE